MGGHTYNVVRTENGLLTCSCWQLVRTSQTDALYFDSLRLDLSPIAYKYYRKPSDIYAEEDLEAIMIEQYKLIELIIELSDKTLLLSQSVAKNVTDHLGKSVVNKYVTNGKLFSLYDSKLVTVSHAENFTNPGYHNGNTSDMCTAWDGMMTDVRAFGGVDIPCTSAANITNIVEGSEEHMLFLARDAATYRGVNKIKN